MSFYCANDTWLSDLMSREVYRITQQAADHSPLAPSFLRARDGKPLFMYAKIGVSQVSQIESLETQGFRLVDTNVVFSKRPGAIQAPRGSVAVRYAEPKDRDGAVAVASHSFKYSRFHLDPKVERSLADRIKAEWVSNFFLGSRGDAMVVASVGDKIVGFLQLLRGKDQTLIIDLIAVDPTCQGQGIGKAMIGFAERSNPELKEIRVGTQIANTPSVRFYESLGFSLCEASYVLHYHSG